MQYWEFIQGILKVLIFSRNWIPEQTLEFNLNKLPVLALILILLKRGAGPLVRSLLLQRRVRVRDFWTLI